jgi:hypothetical protein
MKFNTALIHDENLAIDKYKILELLFDDSEEESERNIVRFIRDNVRCGYNTTVEPVNKCEGR